MLGAKKVAQLTGCIYQCIVCRFNCKSQWVASSIAINMIYSMAFIALMIITLTSARTDDWATYMHDVARTGITLEQLELPLSEQWVFISKHPPQPAWEPPKPAPIEGILEVNRLCFDDAYQVAVVGEWVYFGSSADSKVYCLNASTGEVRWTFFTGGPVRFAPTVWRGRVFVGSDDGYVYCLRATDGKLLWKFKAAPSDEKVLGNGKMISLWPVRTGVLVYDGIAYFGAGIFPSEGVYLYAVRAKDGKLIWKNDSWGYSLSGWRSRSPQGYLLAAANRLFVPCGRALPACFDRRTGSFLYQREYGWRSAGVIGGTYALLAGNYLYTGANVIPAYNRRNGRIGFAWFPGRQLIVTMDVSYMATEKELLALDRTTYYEASRKRQALNNRRMALNGKWTTLRRERDSLRRRIKELQSAINAIDRQLKELSEKQSEKIAALKSSRDKLSKELNVATEQERNATKQLADVEKELKALREEQKKLEEYISKSTIIWKQPIECSDSMVLAGEVLFVGGRDKVIAVDAATGKELWRHKVDGRARGLAVANGRLFVSTNKGVIHCFAHGDTSKPKRVVDTIEPYPYPMDELMRICEEVAEQIVRETGVRRGYCLVLGCGTGRLAFALARRTDLIIYGIEPDKDKVKRARKALDKAGLYGVRVSIDEGTLSALPYSDYFADLIVSENMLVSGRINASAKEMFRVLKPCGGVAYLGQPAATMKFFKRLKAKHLRKWLTDAGIDDFEIIDRNGVWVKLKRGQLPGAGRWTHQYADPGNTACSDDEIVKCPLGVLWFGNPGPSKMVNRHARAAAPLSANGRLFVQGDNVVMAYDAYNGVRLWERKIEGAVRTGVGHECSNLACNDDSLFVAVKDRCLRLDGATGRTLNTYTLPPSPDGKLRSWGYIAVVGDTLFGSTRTAGTVSDMLFAVDIKTGKHQWVYRGKAIAHTAIAIGDGRIFFADSGITAEQRREALKEKLERLKKLTGLDAVKLREEIDRADVRLVVALDANTGRVIWQRPVDLTDCGGSTLHAIYRDGVLLFCGAFQNGHFWREFFAGELARRRITALNAEDGRLLWSRALGYRTRPLVNGSIIYADPWAFDLRTGKQMMRIHPVSGEKVPWEFGRGHHCGPPSGSRYCLFFRSLTTAYYDLIRDSGVLHVGGHRPGCHINMIAANGLVLEPEASSGCQCLFSLYSTIVFKPKRVDRAWGTFCSQSPITPVKHLAINLGAPGDRRDNNGTLWLAYPRPSLPLVLRFNMPTTILPGFGYFMLNPDGTYIEGTDKPWLYTFGSCGITKCVIPVISKGQEPATYTVRLHFAELTNSRPGQRVFDIKVQGKTIVSQFDILSEAGAPNKALVKEFRGIPVSDNLTLEFVPVVEKPTKEQAPLVCGIEVIKE